MAHETSALSVPASVIVEEWLAEMAVRRTLTPEQNRLRRIELRKKRDREISAALGRPYRRMADF